MRDKAQPKAPYFISPAPAPHSVAPRGSAMFGFNTWNRENPNSLVNKIPDEMKQALDRAYRRNPDWFDLEDATLAKTAKERGLMLTVLDNRLRISLWLEYDCAVNEGREIKPYYIYRGLCTEEVFLKVLNSDHKVAWIFTPPAKYERVLEEALTYGLEQLRFILELPNFKSDGNTPDHSTLRLKMGVVQMLDQRAKGGYTQKIEQKSMHLIHKTGDELFKMTSMEEMNRKIQEVEMQLAKAQNGNVLEHRPPDVIDVSPGTPQPEKVRVGKERP